MTTPPQLPISIVVMGPSGVGKSTIGRRLADALQIYDFVDADDYHSTTNLQKMASGIPLTDADRLPWLYHLRQEIIEKKNNIFKTEAGEQRRGVVLACSALKEIYRNVLRLSTTSSSSSSSSINNLELPPVFFLELTGTPGLVGGRLQGRDSQAAFLPLELLNSQFTDLEPLRLNVENGMRISVELGPEEIVQDVVMELKRKQLIP